MPREEQHVEHDGRLIAARNRRRAAKSGAMLTNEQNAESGFRATESLSDNLQKVLVSTPSSSRARASRRTGTSSARTSATRHRQLDEAPSRLPASSATPSPSACAHSMPCPTRSDTVAETTTLAELPQGEIGHHRGHRSGDRATEAVIGTCRDVHDDVDDEDPTSADILHAILEIARAVRVDGERREPHARALSEGGRAALVACRWVAVV